MIKSEFSYLCSVEDALIKKFLIPLRNETTESDYGAALNNLTSFLSLRTSATPQDIRAIFSNIEVLIDVNRKLFEALLLVPRDRDVAVNLAREWTKMAPFLKMYSVYINNYKMAVTTVQRLRQTSRVFEAKIKEIEMQVQANPRTKDSGDLLLLLALPLNRIPKYSHYLEQIMIAVTESDNGFGEIKKAHELMIAVDQHVNHALRMSEHQQALLDVGRKIYGFESLVEPHRRFIDECGCAWSLKTHTVTAGYLFLFNDVLLACVCHAGGDGFDVEAVIKLVCAMCEPLASHGLKLINELGDECLISAESQSNRDRMMKALNAAIADQGTGTRVFGIPLGLILSRKHETFHVPLLLHDAIEHLRKYHMDEEGIFRKSGSADEIQQMTDLVDSGVRLSFEGIDPHNISGLVKRFLRSMRVPVLRPLYHDLLAAVGQPSRLFLFLHVSQIGHEP
eukprot:c12278_g1_i1.p1 GENE.c12278_g1_i1~~c12278_g1_i1.p1  ORF type:complete len:505 (-),score=99.98 c12278_g1_i1:1134-2486(-)